MERQPLDVIVELVAENEPVTPDEVSDLLDGEIDADRAGDYLTVAEERGRILEVNDKYWVMRIGPYSDYPE